MVKIIDVIIPTYNRLPFLKKLLKSLGQQTIAREKFTIFVVNDGSTDNTADYLKQNNIPHININNSGPAVARNTGVANTQSPLLAFIDDDAEADSEWLNTALQNFQQYHLTGAAEGDVVLRGEKLPLSHHISHQGAGGWMTCNLIINRNLFLETGGFDENFKYPINEDYDFFLRLTKNTPIMYFENMKVYHPVIKLPFLQSLANSFDYSKKVADSEILLMKNHPENYRKVKFSKSARETLNRFSKFYLISQAKKELPFFPKHPLRYIMWLSICFFRQCGFLTLKIKGYW